MESRNTKFEVIQKFTYYYIQKTDGSKFEYEGRKYKYWRRKKFKKVECYAACSFLNGLSNIKKSKKKDFDIFGTNKKKSKRIQKKVTECDPFLCSHS
tara:strand:+ start:289 stop:579 length:291 start_codon:yes stop_codon:yes gene_type:complete